MLSIKSIYQLSYVNKILALSKLKVFADDNFNVIQMVRFFFGRVENILGKGENAGYQHFSLFLQCFNPFPNKPWFLRVCSTSFSKTLWEKEKLLITSNFSFSHSVFYPYKELSVLSIQSEIFVCKLLQFGRLQNLSF